MLAALTLVAPAAVAAPTVEEAEAEAAASFGSRQFAQAGRLYEELFERTGRPPHLLAAARAFAAIRTPEGRARASEVASRYRELSGSDPAAISGVLAAAESAAALSVPPAATQPSPSALGYPRYLEQTPQPPPQRSRDEKPYREGATVPPGYHVETRAGELVIGGAIALGSSYLPTVSLGTLILARGNHELATLYIPIAGPFIAVGHVNYRRDPDGSDLNNSLPYVLAVGLILDGIAQTAGAVLLIAGASSPKKVVVKDGAAAVDTTPHIRLAGDRILVEGRF